MINTDEMKKFRELVKASLDVHSVKEAEEFALKCNISEIEIRDIRIKMLQQKLDICEKEIKTLRQKDCRVLMMDKEEDGD